MNSKSVAESLAAEFLQVAKQFQVPQGTKESSGGKESVVLWNWNQDNHLLNDKSLSYSRSISLGLSKINDKC